MIQPIVQSVALTISPSRKNFFIDIKRDKKTKFCRTKTILSTVRPDPDPDPDSEKSDPGLYHDSDELYTEKAGSGPRSEF